MPSVTVALPNRPVITIHKDWAPSKPCRNANKSRPAVDQTPFEAHTFSTLSSEGKSTGAKSPEEGTPLVGPIVSTTGLRGIGQQFNFVNNASEPLHTKDAAVRKLVRSHAMREVVRKRRERKKTKLRHASTKCEKIRRASEELCISQGVTDRLSGDNAISMPPARCQSIPCTQVHADIDYCFNNYLSKLQINISRLKSLYLTQVGSAMLPIEFHHAYDPPTQLWSLDPSFTNEGVIYQSLIYAAAVCSALAEGKKHSSEIAAQRGLTIGLINKLLDGGLWMADGILGAVCHLAVGEALRGNINEWAVHMTGLKKIVRMRGGMDQIHFYLRMKLHRADLLGSHDQVRRPFFEFDMSRRAAVHTKPWMPACDRLPDTNAAPTKLRAVLPKFADLLAEFRVFSKAVERTLLTPEARLDPKKFIEDWYSIEYQLLLSGPKEDVSDGDFIREDNDLGEAFRLAALIYMKELLRKFLFSTIGSRILVSKLKTSLGNVLTTEVTPASSSLLLWLLFIGGAASLENRLDHTFFIAHLVRLRRELELYEWEDVKERLEHVLWIGKMLDKHGEDLWEEVRLAWRVLR